MTNTELIKALRCGGHNMIFHYCDKEDCPYCQYSCHDNLHRCNVQELGVDAANALEAAEQRIAKLEADKKTLINVVKDKSDFHATKDAMKIAELEAQMPKEGEWIVEEIDDSGFKWCKWRCSVCREAVKKGWQHTKDGEKPKWKYCPNCGARMMFNGK